MTEQMLTIDIDERVHDQLRAARTEGPTAIDEMVGAVVALRYDDVERLSHDARLAGIGLMAFDLMGVPDGPLRTWYSQLMFTNEGDEHNRLRRLAARVFTPRSVERHRELAAELTAAAFTDVVARGGGDLVEAFAQVPIRVICRLLGVPDEDVANFVAYADALSPVFGFMDPEQIERADAAVQRLMVDVERMIDARADQRGDDLISALLEAEADGERLTHDEVVVMVGNLIVGGHDTTASQISCSLLTLMRHPAVLAELRVDPSLASAVVSETIRFEPSIRIVPRTVIEPIEVGGVERAAGTLLFLSSCSTSREADVWGDPDEFRPARFTEPGAPKLLSFGAGPHYCLGAALARMTLEEVVRGAAAADLGDRIVPAIDITVGAEVEWRQVLGYSPAALPVVTR
jgi:cytochrome P450